jgi:acid phosphatase
VFGAIVAVVLVLVFATGLKSGGAAGGAQIRPVLPNSFVFFGIGDWGREGSPEQAAVAVAMAAWAGQLGPAFIVNVGDNFYENGVANATDPQWVSSFTAVYPQPSLRVPWYSLLGNHDLRQSMAAQRNWAGDARWRMPDYNYTLTLPLPAAKVGGAAGGVRGAGAGNERAAGDSSGNGAGAGARNCLALVFTHTCPLITSYYSKTGKEYEQFLANLRQTDPAAEVAWLDSRLAAAAAQCNAVMTVGHHPIYSGGDHGDSPDLIAAFLPLLVKHGADAYISGHDHTLIHLAANGTQFVVTGAGSRVRDNTQWTPQTTWFGDVPGFTIHSVNSTHAAHTYVRYDGTLLYQAVAPLKAKGD